MDAKLAYEHAKAVGWNEAVEECARIAESHSTNLEGDAAAFVHRTARKIADNIRALDKSVQAIDD